MTRDVVVEVATFAGDWSVIDRAEPEDSDGAACALLTLWEDSEQHGTGVAFAAEYVDGRLLRLFASKHEVTAYAEASR